MREMPDAYRGREQTWLKHEVLREYVTQWAHKWGSVKTRDVHLWFVDCFAGPWESRDEERGDTSLAIGLDALNTAAETWAAKGHRVRLHAVAIGRTEDQAAALRAFARAHGRAVDVRVLRGTFGEHVGQLEVWLGRDPAFVFVDPTGWKGADLSFVARLARRERRDVLVNVMYGDLRRFQDDQREWLRAQMRDFFGLRDEDLPAGLSEPELMAFYRDRLRRAADVAYAADLAVPVPDADRTRFRLVVAGHHPATLELFRDVEARVVGKEAAGVRSAARDRKRDERRLQPTLLDPLPPPLDPVYDAEHSAAIRAVTIAIPELVRARGRVSFLELWPQLLCEHHLRLKELKHVVLDLRRRGLIEIRGMGPRERTVHDHHVLVAPPAASARS